MASRSPYGCQASDGGSTGTSRHRLDRFQSHDRDETSAHLGDRYGDRSRVSRGTGAFFYGHVVVESPRTAVGRVRTTLPQTLRTAVRHPTLYLPMRARDNYQIGRRAFESNPHQAMLLAQGHDYTCLSGANEWLGLVVSGDLLSEEIAARRRGRSRPWLFKSVEIPLSPGGVAQLKDFYWRARDMSTASAGSAEVDCVHHAERDAAAWLAGIVLDQSGEVGVSQAKVRWFERLERWLDAHLDESITLDRLSAVSGVRGRALQKSVMALRGQSPLEWVTARRLAGVRAHLLRNPSRAVISRIALDFGFTHLGRFSACYREAYGELPSETLGVARSRRGDGRARAA
jgi:AraC-like DNA-binding protein